MSRKDKQKRSKPSRQKSADNSGEPEIRSNAEEQQAISNAGLFSRPGFLFGLAFLVVLTIWAYWPTIRWMEDQWRHEADYSHGYLVFPLAVWMLYFRRGTMPKPLARVSPFAIVFLLIAIAMRVVGRFAYMDFVDGWTLIPWVGGLIWLICGWRFFRWCLPAVLFLFFLVPLPYRAESMLSWQLQGVATHLSVAALRVGGFPAVPEGNTIWLEGNHLLVEEACSGLRIFVGMIAIGFWYAAVSTRHWSDRVVLLFSSLPIAIIVNVLRVSATVLAFHFFSGAASHIAHDLLGWLMVIAGAGLMFAVRSYWERVFRQVDRSIPLNLRPI